MLPGLCEEANARWFGDRPGTPDSLPVLGAAPGHSNVWYAFGHGQLGLTLAAITGRLLVDLMAGRRPCVDPTPFRPDRFVAIG
jgi:D-amino-acid dehydrogenase